MSRRSTFAFVLLTLTGASALSAQQGVAPLPGYTLAGSAAERTLEAQAIARPSASRARDHSRTLSAETHVSGTPAQARTRDYVIAQMRAMGLETEVRQYDVFMPHPTSAQLWRVAPRPHRLPLAIHLLGGAGVAPEDQDTGDGGDRHHPVGRLRRFRPFRSLRARTVSRSPSPL